jgi:hypothetical protein
MPYYVGAGTPEWDTYLEGAQTESGEPPQSLFTYIEPSAAVTTMLAFPETPGPEPEIPPRGIHSPSPASKPGFFARLFGAKAAPAEEAPQLTPEQLLESFNAKEKAIAAHALWKVSRLTAAYRALGVKRVFGSYDGGGDESFTYFRGVEMRDGRVIRPASLPEEMRAIDDGQLVEDAAAALMGTFDAGEFVLHGVLIIDFDACTITDEKNADVIFGDKMPWEV